MVISRSKSETAIRSRSFKRLQGKIHYLGKYRLTPIRYYPDLKELRYSVYITKRKSAFKTWPVLKVLHLELDLTLCLKLLKTALIAHLNERSAVLLSLIIMCLQLSAEISNSFFIKSFPFRVIRVLNKLPVDHFSTPIVFKLTKCPEHLDLEQIYEFGFNGSEIFF